MLISTLGFRLWFLYFSWLVKHIAQFKLWKKVQNQRKLFQMIQTNIKSNIDVFDERLLRFLNRLWSMYLSILFGRIDFRAKKKC